MMEICGGGVLCLRKSSVGTPMTFFDVGRAEEEGYFGENPKIWEEEDYDSLIELRAIGFQTSPDELDQASLPPYGLVEKRHRRGAQTNARTGQGPDSTG